jgi:hypothetical protein
MIRAICHCPFCPQGVVAVDDDVPRLVFNPDGTVSAPCVHLAFMSAVLHAEENSGKVSHPRCGSWCWLHGADLRESSLNRERGDFLLEYLDEFALDLVCDERLNCLAYHATGGTACQREEKCKGTGELDLRPENGQPLFGILDGWGIYSQRPEAFVAAVKKETCRLLASDGAQSGFEQINALLAEFT